MDGQSTIARLGLTIHNTAKIMDGVPFEPHSTVLEIYNHSNRTYLLKAGLAISCVTFELLAEAPSDNNYQNQYKGQTGFLPPNTKFQPPEF